MPQESNFYKAYKLAYSDRTLLIKKSILAIVIMVCFGLGSVFFLNFLNNFSNINLIVAVLLWSIGISLLPIFFLVFPFSNFLLWNLGISIAPFLPLLLKGQWSLYFFAIIVFIFLLFLCSRASMKGESNDLLDLKWRRIVLKGSFFLLLSLVAILVTLVCFQGKTAQIEQSGEKLLDTIINQSESAQSIFGIQLTGTIDEVLKSYLEKEASDLDGLDETFLNQMKSNLSGFLNIPLTGEEKLSSLIIDWIKNYWQTVSPQLKLGLTLVAFILILSVLKFINIIFSLILVLFSWISLQILLSLKYLTIKRIGVEKQEITIAL